MLADAEERSTSMVAEARATADRVRAESDRELAAAGQRRDSINAQLSNVRQMLTTLSGSGIPGVGMVPPAMAEEAPEEETEEEPESGPVDSDDTRAASGAVSQAASTSA